MICRWRSAGLTALVRPNRPCVPASGQACRCCLAPLTRTGTDPAGDRWVAWVASACHAGTRARLSNTGVSRILRQKGPSRISRPSERSRGWGRQIEADIVRVGPSKAVSGCRTLPKRIAGGWRASRGLWVIAQLRTPGLETKMLAFGRGYPEAASPESAQARYCPATSPSCEPICPSISGYVDEPPAEEGGGMASSRPRAC